MRQLATIQRIISLAPIPGADSIEVATVLGWECVVKKGEFNVGDLGVYIEIDSKCPKAEWSEFLLPSKFIVKTIRLRKQVSQGLMMPLSTFPAISKKVKEGEDVTEILGITKHDPQGEIERQEAAAARRLPKNFLLAILHMFYYRYLHKYVKKYYQRRGWPSFVSKTDETRIQNLHKTIADLEGKELPCTEKLDGQSATYYLVKDGFWPFSKFKFGVLSRNCVRSDRDGSSYATCARQYDIKNKLHILLERGGARWIVLQGEIIGGNIQGNKYGISGYEFYAFNLYYSNGTPRLSTSTMATVLGANDIRIPCVPILMPIKIFGTVPENVPYSKGKSVLKGTVDREGIVVRKPGTNISFKIINPDFLLKNTED